RAIFEDHGVCGSLCARQRIGRRLWTAKVDGRQLGAQVKRNRGESIALLEYCREQMLAGVLLHVVKTAWPIYAAVDRAAGNFPVDNVSDLVAGISHVQNLSFAQFSQVVRLAAGVRIERGAVEEDFPGRPSAGWRGKWLGREAADHSGREILEKTIVVI